MQISPSKNPNFYKPSRNLSNRTKVKIWKTKFWDISQNKFGSSYAQSPRKCSNIEILAKIEGKEAKFFSKIYEGHIGIWFRSKKKFKIISCLCTFKEGEIARLWELSVYRTWYLSGQNSVFVGFRVHSVENSSAWYREKPLPYKQQCVYTRIHNCTFPFDCRIS
jgi:hypothetical protein